MLRNPVVDTGLRRAELIAALSLATDLGMGPAELRAVYYQALLRYIGCNAETHAMATLFGDELALRADYATVDPGRPRDLLAFVLRNLHCENCVFLSII